MFGMFNSIIVEFYVPDVDLFRLLVTVNESNGTFYDHIRRPSCTWRCISPKISAWLILGQLVDCYDYG